MGIKRKFQIFAGIIGVLLVIVSIVGFLTANSNLEESVEAEVKTVAGKEASELDGWFIEKGASATYASSLMTSFKGDLSRIQSIDSLSSIAKDKEILDLNIGTEDDFFASFYGGNMTGKLIPKERPWYQDAKKAGKTVFTDPYVDRNTGKLVVSAVSPFDANGKFYGVLCTDIGLDVVSERAKKAKYRGEEGSGIVFDAKGEIIGTAGKEEIMSNIKDIKGIGEHLDEMVKNDNGFFFYQDADGKDMVFGYATMPSNGWMFGLSVSYDYAFASVSKLQLTYAILTIVGFLIVVAMSIKFSMQITKPIVALEEHANELSNGNLRLEDIPRTTNDEIGKLTDAFNKMRANLSKLIHSMATSAEQVAASSEELTANAQQSAEVSVRVAETVSEVNQNMDQQLLNVATAKENVNHVYDDIHMMSERADEATNASVETAEVARVGSELMKNAIEKMTSLEKSVMESATVVKQLGENSKQIGQIVDAISSIAEQTNLLSLNAAIEAARAGEQGKGFAVVADEVRKLASESQLSAEKIKERIDSIQSDTEKAVTSMETGTHEVEEGTQAIHKVGEQFKEIMEKVKGIEGHMKTIKTSVQTVSDGANRIVEAVDAIDEASKNTAEHTKMISYSTEQQSASNEEIAAASHALANMATEMNGAIGEFKL